MRASERKVGCVRDSPGRKRGIMKWMHACGDQVRMTGWWKTIVGVVPVSDAALQRQLALAFCGLGSSMAPSLLRPFGHIRIAPFAGISSSERSTVLVSQ